MWCTILKLIGRGKKKGKEHDETKLETLNLDDVDSNDEWIIKEESSNHLTNEE